MHPRTPVSTDPIRRDRIRRIDGGFAFLPCRFLHQGFLRTLGRNECVLYLFLVLAGDRNGVSYYSHERIGDTLRLELHEILEARDHLIRRDLIAFDGLRFQVLHLPPSPTQLPEDDPA